MSRDRLLLHLWAFVTLGLLVRAFAGGVLGDQEPPAWTVAPVRIDVNRASVAELTVLPGIGPARAEAIVLARVRRGWFRSLDELGEVDGFGPGILAGLAQHVTFGAR
ncbi:MAG: helix-hairpin-helix domain-containing protein [Planctomycetota bacterium]